jgi:glycyl-tRNA synthetase beta chain
VPELFIELFSEEIPARMQARAADDLARLVGEALAALSPSGVRTFFGPRRIALAAEVAAETPAARSSERGPRETAPEQALAGFLRKHAASREQLRLEGGFFVLDRSSEPTPAASVVAAAMPPLLRRFPWPKSMRWGGTSAFAWVRPLRRIVCLLDGRVVTFDLRDGDDEGHGLAASNLTEGHRFLAPGAFAVEGADDWREKLRAARVMVDGRREAVAQGISGLAASKGLTVVDDPGLLDEVAGLVEWPVPLLGRIDAAFMDLPSEVMQVSMRVNQRYFALRNEDGSAAPWFGFAANIEADDGGAAVVAGNERVLRARFSDARHFWDLDRRTRLADRVPALEAVTFHAKLGSQGERARRLARLAAVIAPLVGADPALAERAALLAKADLTSGMVGEFPELQGVIGRYCALHDGEPAEVADAVRDHYAPKGPSDPVPVARVSAAVALADKLDLIAAFFGVGEAPTGSGDPFALRRAALGVIRIIRENGFRLDLRALVQAAADGDPAPVLAFIEDRLRVQLKAEGVRHDVAAAVLALRDDDLTRKLARLSAISALLGSADGANLIAAYRRAANILRIEDRKDGPHAPSPNPALLLQAEEAALAEALDRSDPAIAARLQAEDYAGAMAVMAGLRAPLDAFFDRVTVNAPEPELRRNRLALLSKIRSVMDQVADFSKLEGDAT